MIDIVEKRTGTITDTSIQINFSYGYATEPLVLLSVYGAPTIFTPTFIYNSDIPQLIVAVQLIFNSECIGKKYSMIVVGV